MAYPADRLLPCPTYTVWEEMPEPVAQHGWLVRRTDGARPAFRVIERATGRLRLDVQQLCSPSSNLLRLSCNLLGQFERPDAGWRPGTDAAKVKLNADWKSDSAVVPPTSEEMLAAPPPWGLYGIRVARLPALRLTLREATTTAPAWEVTCHAQHVPNCWNYWHVELRFYDSAAKRWLNDEEYPWPSNSQKRKLPDKLRTAFREAEVAEPLAATLHPAPWPAVLFDLAARTTP